MTHTKHLKICHTWIRLFENLADITVRTSKQLQLWREKRFQENFASKNFRCRPILSHFIEKIWMFFWSTCQSIVMNHCRSTCYGVLAINLIILHEYRWWFRNIGSFLMANSWRDYYQEDLYPYWCSKNVTFQILALILNICAGYFRWITYYV